MSVSMETRVVDGGAGDDGEEVRQKVRLRLCDSQQFQPDLLLLRPLARLQIVVLFVSGLEPSLELGADFGRRRLLSTGHSASAFCSR
jgi:hypothetical protein